MYQGLKCFDYRLYPSIADIDKSFEQRQCIAPTAKGWRCTWKISEDDLIKATSLRKDAENFIDGAIRDELIRQYAILRCCEKATHREKLQYDAPECLGALVARYGSMIPRGNQISNAQYPQRQSQRSQTKQGRSSKRAVDGSNSSSNKSSPYSSLSIPRKNPATGEVFIPYKTDTPDTVRSVILSDIPPPSSEQLSPRRGEVYCFTQSVTPDYVKIGYTGKTAAERLATLQTQCFPQAVLQCHCQFAFPERMERLVHLQMVQWRRKLVRCRLCGSGHQEFFEVSVTHAAGIIHDWARVAQWEPLYDDSTGVLTAAWRNRIANIKGDITAKKLLKVLAEETKKRKAQTDEEAAACKIQLSSPLPSSSSLLLPNFKIIAGTTTASAYRHRILLDDDKDRILAYFEDVIRSLFQDDGVAVVPPPPPPPPPTIPLVGADAGPAQASGLIPVVA